MASPTIELVRPVPRPRPVVVAGSLAAVGVSLIIVSILLYLSEGLPRLRVSFAQTPAALLPQQATAAGYILVGALLGSRLPRNPVGWLLLAAGLVWATLLPLSMLVTVAHEALRPVPPVTLGLAWLSSSFATPVLAMLMGLAALLFPDGRLVGPRWRPVAFLLVLAPLLLGLTAAVGPSSLVWYWTLPNPLAVPRTFSPVVFGIQVGAIALLVMAFAGLVASLVVRYRRGDAVTRAQLRWIVFAIAIQAICAVPFVLARYVVPVSASVGEMTVAASVAASLLLPITGAVAITRHHLFGIDRVINRTLVYVPLLGLLGGLYAAAAALFQRLFVTLTGEPSEVPLLMAVFIIAAAFTPVRKWLEGVVDRWAHAPSMAAAGATAGDATAAGATAGDATAAGPVARHAGPGRAAAPPPHRPWARGHPWTTPSCCAWPPRCWPCAASKSAWRPCPRTPWPSRPRVARRAPTRHPRRQTPAHPRGVGRLPHGRPRDAGHLPGLPAPAGHRDHSAGGDLRSSGRGRCAGGRRCLSEGGPPRSPVYSGHDRATDPHPRRPAAAPRRAARRQLREVPPRAAR